MSSAQGIVYAYGGLFPIRVVSRKDSKGEPVGGIHGGSKVGLRDCSLPRTRTSKTKAEKRLEDRQKSFEGFTGRTFSGKPVKYHKPGSMKHPY